MLWALMLIPAVCGILVFLPFIGRLSRTILITAAAAHSAGVAAIWAAPLTKAFLPPEFAPDLPFSAAGGWLGCDALSLLILTICSFLFLGSALYALGYLGPERKQLVKDYLDELHFNNQPDRVFIACMLFFLASMTLVTTACHMGILWVAVEATTLSSTPLIYYHRHHRSLEAAWKYLLLCSVGIALALLGNFFLSVSTAASDEGELSLLIPELTRHARELSPNWLKASFVLMLVGYGTKMGMAPMHSWLPDAHSEAPSPVSALMSGALLNCAFLAIVRMLGIVEAAGMGETGRELLIGFGLFSMGWAAMLLISQTDFKRMLAYSSVEHMGVVALGTGLGGMAAAGSMLHAVNHSLTKGALFLVAGNLLARYRTKNVSDVSGLLKSMPSDGVLWVAGLFAITGAPPFGLFISELMILKGAVSAGRPVVAILYLAALAIAFAAMMWTLIRMAWGPAVSPDRLQTAATRSVFSVTVPAVLLAFVLAFGIHVPSPLRELVESAAKLVSGGL